MGKNTVMPSTAALFAFVALPLILLAAFACGPKPPGMPLLDAIDQEDTDVVRDHMEFGTDPNETFIPLGIPFAGASALHLAVLKDNREIAQILLDNGADIDTRARDEFKGPALEWAVFFGIKDMGIFLVEAGADVNAKNAIGTTPIDAADADNSFASGDDLKELDENRAFLKDYLRARGGKSGLPQISLLDAIDQDDADAVGKHMESGTDPNETFVPPGIPFAGASALHVAVLKNNREIVTILLDNGADIDIRARDDFGGSPLEWAVFFAIRDMGVFLVESGADVNAKNAIGTTPIDAAGSDNPFVSAEDLAEFKANRAFLKEYLTEQGAKSGE